MSLSSSPSSNANENENENSADNLAEEMSLPEKLEAFIDDLVNKIKAWFINKQDDPSSDEAEGAGNGVSPEQAATIATEIANNLTFDEIPDSVHNLKQRQHGMFTSGMFGFEGTGDGEFNLELADEEFRKLVEEQDVRNVVTLCGESADVGIRSRLNELGFSHVNTLSFRIHTVQTLEEAEAAYNDRLVRSLGLCFNMVQSGNTCIHCQNGAHRSLTVSLIMFMLAHPDMTYQQCLAANLSPREAANGHFKEYSRLAQVLENNPELRQRILDI
jgi:hypothetical protein